MGARSAAAHRSQRNGYAPRQSGKHHDHHEHRRLSVKMLRLVPLFPATPPATGAPQEVAGEGSGRCSSSTVLRSGERVLPPAYKPWVRREKRELAPEGAKE